ncbi:MAG: glycosyltransferase family 2 protein [Phycisphaerales bacterium]
MRVVAVVPTYQNAGTLRGVLDALETQGFSIIVVDDGSTDGTGELLRAWTRERPRERTVVSLERNRGKGAALAAGFAAAVDAGARRIVTVDADGQHRAGDARRIADQPGDAMIVGARAEGSAAYPRRSRFGRRLWALGVRSLTGLGLADPVCGLRAYPAEAVARVRPRFGRFCWEIEWIVRAAWSGVRVEELPIETIYLPRGERVSHWSLGDWPHNFAGWMALAGERVLLLRGPWRPAADQPLRAHDRSWRRLQIVGAAVAAGIGAGGAPFGWTGLALVATVATAIAIRLHVLAPIGALAAAAGWYVVAAR